MVDEWSGEAKREREMIFFFFLQERKRKQEADEEKKQNEELKKAIELSAAESPVRNQDSR